MARIIVTTDPIDKATPPCCSTSASAQNISATTTLPAQPIERLGWAITDVESTQPAEQTL
jgi:hypothetical protein